MEYSVVTSVGKRKTDLSPRRESNPRPHVRGRSGALTTGRLVASTTVFTESVVTRVLHTARISNVESTVCDNKERKMVKKTKPKQKQTNKQTNELTNTIFFSL